MGPEFKSLRSTLLFTRANCWWLSCKSRRYLPGRYRSHMSSFATRAPGPIPPKLAGYDHIRGCTTNPFYKPPASLHSHFILCFAKATYASALIYQSLGSLLYLFLPDEQHTWILRADLPPTSALPAWTHVTDPPHKTIPIITRL